MKVKRYIGNDLSEAMIRVKNELGRDAVILHTRKIKKKGISGWFGGKLVEVVAAIDEPDVKIEQKGKSHEQEVQDALEAIRQISEQKKTNPIPETVQPTHDVVAEPSLTGEVNELKKMVFQMMEKLESKQTPSNHATDKNVLESLAKPEIGVEARSEEPLVQTLKSTIAIEPSSELIAQLRDKELAEYTIESILSSINVHDSQDPLNDLKPVIRNMLGEPYTIESRSDSQSVFLFVGPTGVGKTTTLAKLAARLSLVENRSVGLITADTFRIAAVEQLKTYSEILGIPLTVIYEPEEVKEALKKYKEKDFVLVDTAGRSHKSDELKNDLDNLLKHLKNPEIFLVISLTTGYKDIVSILNSYEFLKDYKLLFTKLDEASSLGNILNVKAHTGKPLSYFAIGQSVPDDIEIANVEKVVNFIVGE